MPNTKEIEHIIEAERRRAENNAKRKNYRVVRTYRASDGKSPVVRAEKKEHMTKKERLKRRKERLNAYINADEGGMNGNEKSRD